MTSAVVSASKGLRSSAVPWTLRAANLLFGSPSIRRANGGAKTDLLPRVLRDRFSPKASEVPVFTLDGKDGDDAGKLPRIWLSEPCAEGAGRRFVKSYPQSADRGGWKALELAEQCLAEAFHRVSPEEGEVRRNCYQAAEILLLHSVQRGNASAHCRLGMIYENDLCEGDYWNGLLEKRAVHGAEVPLLQRAYRHYSQSAYHGCSEALWRLGDLYAAGKGCERSAVKAVRLYRLAFDRESGVEGEDRAQTGMAALRIARAWELGRGCQQSFRRARTWYRVAACSLGAAFDGGQWHYKRERIEARRGVARMAQEIAGTY